MELETLNNDEPRDRGDTHSRNRAQLVYEKNDGPKAAASLAQEAKSATQYQKSAGRIIT